MAAAEPKQGPIGWAEWTFFSAYAPDALQQFKGSLTVSLTVAKTGASAWLTGVDSVLAFSAESEKVKWNANWVSRKLCSIFHVQRLRGTS
jgi:hypothetical protein